MGMFDSAYVYMECPVCKKRASIEWQTKDMDNSMWAFAPLPEYWFGDGKLFGRKFREGLPVFPSTPHDKAHKVWENQAERTEAHARVSDEWLKLKYIDVIGSCPFRECNKYYRGKIAIKDGFLIEPVYDIVVEDNE